MERAGARSVQLTSAVSGDDLVLARHSAASSRSHDWPKSVAQLKTPIC